MAWKAVKPLFVCGSDVGLPPTPKILGTGRVFPRTGQKEKKSLLIRFPIISTGFCGEKLSRARRMQRAAGHIQGEARKTAKRSKIGKKAR
jgi:hypothetical protein